MQHPSPLPSPDRSAAYAAYAAHKAALAALRAAEERSQMHPSAAARAELRAAELLEEQTADTVDAFGPVPS